MFINRGNHETKEMNRTYGFEGEAKHKHGDMTYKVKKIENEFVIKCLTGHSYLSSSHMFSLLVRILH